MEEKIEKIIVDPFDVRTIASYIGDVDEKERNIRIREIIRLILDHYSELELERIIEYISGKYNIKKHTLKEIVKKIKKESIKDKDDELKVIEHVDNEFLEKNKELKFLSKEVLDLLITGHIREASEKLTDAILTNNYIYTIRNDEHAEIWIYVDGIYISQGRTYIREFCRKVIGKSYTTYFINQVIAKVEVDTYIISDDFFSNNIVDEIPVQNGILNIHNGSLTPFTPDKIFFGKLPMVYDKNNKCPNIIKHFQTVLKNNDDIKVMQELFGFILLKDYKIEKAIMFNGSGRNGKGKTLELMKRFVGADNCSSIPIQALEESQFAISGLFGKLANLSGDISPTALKNTGRFKEATGRDMITAERKFLPPIHFTNYAKMIFSCNELPKTYDLTEAFWSRWVYLEFPYTFKTKEEIESMPEEERKNMKIMNPDIINQLTTLDELSGCLNWALEGLKRLLEQKDFSNSKTAEEIKEVWIRKSDSFAAFLMDYIEEEYEGKITKSELRRVYSIYCRKYKLRQSSEKAIKYALSNMGVVEDRYRGEGEQIPYWDGIIFKSGKGGKDGRGFSTYIEVLSFDIGSKPHTKSTILTKLQKNGLNGKDGIDLKVNEEKIDGGGKDGRGFEKHGKNDISLENGKDGGGFEKQIGKIEFDMHNLVNQKCVVCKDSGICNFNSYNQPVCDTCWEKFGNKKYEVK